MIDLLEHQYKFLESNAPSTGLVGGFGCGKSIIATLKCIEKLKSNPCISVGYYLPTYPLIKSIAFKNFRYYLDLLQIDFTLHETDKNIHTPIGNIILRSMDNTDLIVGYEVAYSVIDEADILSKDKMEKAYKAIVSRNRQTMPDGGDNAVDMVSTPEGFKFLYDYYVKNKNERRVLIKGKTLDNPFLPQSYIDNLIDTYPKDQLNAYMSGEFVNLSSGNVYNHFNRDTHHKDIELKENEALHIGMDFNITNMNAVIHVNRMNTYFAVDEVSGAYDTQQICEMIREKYPNNRAVVYPDASGKARSTSGKSDHQILKENRFIIKTPNQNPRVKDRIASQNLAFQKGKYFVDTKKCPNYTEALEQLPYKNGVPDKTSGFDHICEAGGYFVHYMTFRKNKVSLR